MELKNLLMHAQIQVTLSNIHSGFLACAQSTQNAQLLSMLSRSGRIARVYGGPGFGGNACWKQCITPCSGTTSMLLITHFSCIGPFY